MTRPESARGVCHSSRSTPSRPSQIGRLLLGTVTPKGAPNHATERRSAAAPRERRTASTCRPARTSALYVGRSGVRRSVPTMTAAIERSGATSARPSEMSPVHGGPSGMTAGVGVAAPERAIGVLAAQRQTAPRRCRWRTTDARRDCCSVRRSVRPRLPQQLPGLGQYRMEDAATRSSWRWLQPLLQTTDGRPLS